MTAAFRQSALSDANRRQAIMTTKTDEQERETFKRHYGALFDLSETTDTWGNQRFVNESIEAIWYGWKDRAALEADRKRRGEPVAWYTEDHLADLSATTWDQ